MLKTTIKYYRKRYIHNSFSIKHRHAIATTIIDSDALGNNDLSSYNSHTSAELYDINLKIELMNLEQESYNYLVKIFHSQIDVYFEKYPNHPPTKFAFNQNDDSNSVSIEFITSTRFAEEVTSLKILFWNLVEYSNKSIHLIDNQNSI